MRPLGRLRPRGLYPFDPSLRFIRIFAFGEVRVDEVQNVLCRICVRRHLVPDASEVRHDTGDFAKVAGPAATKETEAVEEIERCR